MEKDNCEKNSGCSSCETANQCDEKTKEEHEDLLLRDTLSQIRHKIFVLSGKGGVGKSTVAVNLAVSLSARGFETGILDIDIHGPNVPKMLGIEGWALSADGKGSKISPFRFTTMPAPTTLCGTRFRFRRFGYASGLPPAKALQTRRRGHA